VTPLFTLGDAVVCGERRHLMAQKAETLWTEISVGSAVALADPSGCRGSLRGTPPSYLARILASSCRCSRVSVFTTRKWRTR
jgi:hypothetical protein